MERQNESPMNDATHKNNNENSLSWTSRGTNERETNRNLIMNSYTFFPSVHKKTIVVNETRRRLYKYRCGELVSDSMMQDRLNKLPFISSSNSTLLKQMNSIKTCIGVTENGFSPSTTAMSSLHDRSKYRQNSTTRNNLVHQTASRNRRPIVKSNPQDYEGKQLNGENSPDKTCTHIRNPEEQAMILKYSYHLY